MGGPLQKYWVTSPSGVETMIKYNAADAERHGLTDDDLVDGGQEPAGKARVAAADTSRSEVANKARSAAANKARGTGGKGAAAKPAPEPAAPAAPIDPSGDGGGGGAS